MPQKTITSNCLNKSVNKSLVKDNAMRFVDREKHSYDLMKYALSPCQPHGTLTLPHLRIHLYQHICTAIFMQPIASNSRCCIHAELMMQPHSRGPFVPHRLRCRSYAPFMKPIPRARNVKRIYAAVFTPLHSRHSTYLAFTPPHLCCLSHAATFLPSLSRCSSPATAFMPQLSRRSTGAAILTQQHLWRHIYTAAFTPQNSRCTFAAAFNE